MINISKIVAKWDKEGQWSVAPAGMSWIYSGNRIIVGRDCFIGNRSSIGNDCRMGDGSRIGNGSSIGNGSRIYDNMDNPIDLGHVDGYRRVVGSVFGVAHIDGGCKRLTISGARANWFDDPQRQIALLQLDYAAAIAAHKGWTIT